MSGRYGFRMGNMKWWQRGAGGAPYWFMALSVVVLVAAGTVSVQAISTRQPVDASSRPAYTLPPEATSSLGELTAEAIRGLVTEAGSQVWVDTVISAIG